MSFPTRHGRLLLICLLGLAACAPALDWRETRPEGSGLQLLFPCRPQHQERRIPLAGAVVRMELLSCGAGEQTWALVYADLGDLTRLDATLAALHESAAGKVGGQAPAMATQVVPGATPQPRSGRSRLQGRTPEGQPLQMQTLVFTRGTWVFQASAVGTSISEEAADTFMASIRFPP
jgi:hypothetical protein